VPKQRLLKLSVVPRPPMQEQRFEL